MRKLLVLLLLAVVVHFSIILSGANSNPFSTLYGKTSVSEASTRQRVDLYVITYISYPLPKRISLRQTTTGDHFENIRVGAHCPTLNTVIAVGDTVALVREFGTDDNGHTYEYFIGIPESLGCNSN